MSEIPPVESLTEIPRNAKCQEASALSGNRYFACGGPAVAIIDNGDDRPYLMCKPCAWHNLRNRNARIIFTTDKELPSQQVNTRPSRWSGDPKDVV